MKGKQQGAFGRVRGSQFVEARGGFIGGDQTRYLFFVQCTSD